MPVTKIDSSINLRGVKCPINFVKIKLKLEGMQDGKILEIIIDDGEPVQNIPRAIKEEGHTIMKVEQLSDSSLSILIKKGGRNSG